MSIKRKFYKKSKESMDKSKRKKTYSNGCHYCGRNISGMPHFCKFCGEKHCDKHILPEDHNCQGLKKNSRWKTDHKIHSKTNPYVSSRHISKRSYSGNYSHKHKKKIPRISIPKINIFFKALTIALITFVLAYYYPQYEILLWIEAGAWSYFSFILFRRAFRWTNKVSMADDLAFFGLRILGGIITIVGMYILFATLIASAIVKGSAYQSIPLYCLLTGLILLGAFIAFRTNRRHKVVGIWES